MEILYDKNLNFLHTCSILMMSQKSLNLCPHICVIKKRNNADIGKFSKKQPKNSQDIGKLSELSGSSRTAYGNLFQ